MVRAACWALLTAWVVLAGTAAAAEDTNAVFAPVSEKPVSEKPASEKAQVNDVYLVTFGPGDEVFSKFEHNAIAFVKSPDKPWGLLYNFGVFNNTSPSLATDFLRGRLTYWLEKGTLTAIINQYRRANRSVTAQRLNLTRKQKGTLAQTLRVNALPENRDYKYDYYRDNCSTRVRDVLDKVLDGALSKASQERAGQSFRQHSLRLSADNLPVYLGLHIALTDPVDQPATNWEEQFLPGVLQRQVRKVRVLQDGKQVPLVDKEVVWFAGTRAPSRDQAPDWRPWFALAGLLLGGLGLAAARAARVSVRAATLLFAGAAVQGLLLGCLSTLLCFFWFATDHTAAYANENLLQVPPWLVLLAPLFVAHLWHWRWAHRLATAVLALTAGTSLLGVALKVLPNFDQQNTEFLLLFPPLWCGLALALFKAWGSLSDRKSTHGSL